MNEYDAIPYPVMTHRRTHPAHLAALGRMSGLASADPSSARVLEFGCAAGSNLIPIAWYYPKTRCLGVELSAEQAEAGQRRIAELGLENIRIIQADILQLDDDIGEFDYMIAHGVWSWVPEPVRERMLWLCARHLAPHGIAYVSFNTLPGWRQRGTLRDLALYAGRGASTPTERLARARRFLGELMQDLKGADTDSARLLKDGIESVLGATPGYFYHELLEEVNDPILFSDFMARATAHGFEYLCDADTRWSSTSLFPQTIRARLKRLTDPIEREQYIDVVANRNFRRALLCHQGQIVDRDIKIDHLRDFAFHADLQPSDPPDLDRNCNQVYTAGRDLRVVVTQPITRAALEILAEVWPDSLGFDELLRSAQARLPQTNHADRQDLLAELGGLLIRGTLGLDIAPWSWRIAPCERPAVNRLARAQAAAGEPMSGPRHTGVMLDPSIARLAILLDGTRTARETAQFVAREIVAKGGLATAVPATALPPSGLNATLEEIAEKNTTKLIGLCARNGLLELPSSR